MSRVDSAWLGPRSTHVNSHLVHSIWLGFGLPHLNINHSRVESIWAWSDLTWLGPGPTQFNIGRLVLPLCGTVSTKLNLGFIDWIEMIASEIIELFFQIVEYFLFSINSSSFGGFLWIKNDVKFKNCCFFLVRNPILLWIKVVKSVLFTKINLYYSQLKRLLDQDIVKYFSGFKIVSDIGTERLSKTLVWLFFLLFFCSMSFLSPVWLSRRSGYLSIRLRCLSQFKSVRD